MQFVYLFSHVVVVSPGPPCGCVTGAPLWLCRMASATDVRIERIILPFSSKGVNYMAYLSHVATVVWCVLLFV